jgi:hypothetical protein
MGVVIKNRKFIQKAFTRSKRKGTAGMFKKWCKSKRMLSRNGKITSRCINKGLKSKKLVIRRRAQFLKNIGSFSKSRRNQLEFGRRTKRRTRMEMEFGKRRKTRTKRRTRMEMEFDFGKRRVRRYRNVAGHCNKLRKVDCKGTPDCTYVKQRGCRAKRNVRKGATYSGPFPKNVANPYTYPEDSPETLKQKMIQPRYVTIKDKTDFGRKFKRTRFG